jgi:proline iminopeptidase
MRPLVLTSLLLASFAASLAACSTPQGAGLTGFEPAAAQEGYLPGAEGVRLFYRRVGAGREAIVYLHGGPASGFRGSGEFMDPLAAGRTLVMYDQRSAGLSELVADPARLTLSHNVRDLEALRRHFGFGQMTLIGLSAGAWLAAQYAAEHPGKVDRMILVSPGPPVKSYSAERVRHLDRLLGEEKVKERARLAGLMATAPDSELVNVCRQLSDLTFTLYLAEPTPEKLAIAAKRCDIPPATLRNRGLVRSSISKSMGDYDFRPILARLHMPVLVVEGEATNVPLEPTELWAKTLPNARLVLVPKAGHEFFLDQPAAFIREAEKFLRATSR